jgi:tetratricopeptide (TPR) repeat protein
MPQARTPAQALHDAAAAIARGQFTEAGDIIDQALAQTPRSPETAAELLMMRGVAASEAGRTAQAIETLHAAIRRFEQAGLAYHLKLAEALGLLANEVFQRDPTQALTHLQRALIIYDAQGGSHLHDAHAVQQHIAAVGQLAMLTEMEGDVRTARHHYQQGVALCDQARVVGRLRDLLTEGLARMGGAG